MSLRLEEAVLAPVAVERGVVLFELQLFEEVICFLSLVERFLLQRFLVLRLFNGLFLDDFVVMFHGRLFGPVGVATFVLRLRLAALLVYQREEYFVLVQEAELTVELRLRTVQRLLSQAVRCLLRRLGVPLVRQLQIPVVVVHRLQEAAHLLVAPLLECDFQRAGLLLHLVGWVLEFTFFLLDLVQDSGV